jgi:hypothetical protein
MVKPRQKVPVDRPWRGGEEGLTRGSAECRCGAGRRARADHSPNDQGDGAAAATPLEFPRYPSSDLSRQRR